MIQTPDSCCACPGLPRGAFGESGFHFIEIRSDDYCWRGHRTKWHVDPAGELIEFCGCTSELRRKHRDGSVEVIRERRPECVYRGLSIAYERCPSYYSAPFVRKKPNGDEYAISFDIRREDPLKLTRTTGQDRALDQVADR